MRPALVDLFGTPQPPGELREAAERLARRYGWRVDELTFRPNLLGEPTWFALFRGASGERRERSEADLRLAFAEDDKAGA